jgi:dipeptidase E
MKFVCTGMGKAMSLEKVCSQAIDLSKKQRPSVLYLGTPSYDDHRKFEIQTEGFKKAGCSITKMDLSEVPKARQKRRLVISEDNYSNPCEGENTISNPTYSIMKEEVLNADIIMASGGNTMYGLKRWKLFGMDQLLKKAFLSGKNAPVFCGGSAGAISWFAYGHSDSMNPSSFLNPNPNLTEEEKKNWDYIKLAGLGFLPALCVPHYDIIQHNGLPRSLASETLVREIHDFPCIGIDEEAALVIDGNNVRVIDGSNSGAKCYKKIYYSKTERMEVTPMEESHGDFSLTELFGLN